MEEPSEGFDVEEIVTESLEFFHETKADSKSTNWVKTRLFQCHQCSQTIVGFTASIEHVNTHGQGMRGSFACIQCSSSFSRRDHLKRHVENHILEDLNPELWQMKHQFECQTCSQIVIGLLGSVEHMSKSHHLDPHHCILCPLKFDTQDVLTNHVWTHIKDDYLSSPSKSPKSWVESHLWPCQICPGQEMALKGMNAYIKHMKKHHLSDTGWICPICDKDRFLKKDNFRAHLTLHNDQKMACEFCGRLFANGAKMRRHVQEVHDKLKNHMCIECGKCFSRQEKLRAHEIIHQPGEVKPHLCHECGKGFNRPEHMLRHAKICGRRRIMAFDPTTVDTPRKLLIRLGFEIGIDTLARDPDTLSYPCPECGNQYKDKRYVVEHYARMHREENRKMPYKCEVCQRGFKVQKDLARHLKKANVHKLPKEENKDGLSPPPRCNFDENEAGADQKGILSEGVQDIQEDVAKSEPLSHVITNPKKINVLANSSLLPCTVCGQDFPDKIHLEEHIVTTTLPGHAVVKALRLKSNYAQAAIKLDVMLSEHVQDDPDDPEYVDDIEAFKCMECSTGFITQEALIQHATNHQRQALKAEKTLQKVRGKVDCEALESNEGDNDAKAKRKKIVFKDGVYLPAKPMGCLECDEEFLDKNDLLGHFEAEPHRCQMGKYPMECPIQSCNMIFSSQGRLLQHFKLGKHNQPCPSCGKSFQRLDKLEIHLRSHSADKPYICDQCNRGYKDPTSLQFHRKTHFGAREFLCPDCGAGFMKPDHLKRHINATHLKIKTIKCQFCDVLFGDKYKARIHERTHTGETPYLCSICARAFKRKESLEQHAIVHKDLPKAFKCDVCGTGFKTRQYLNRHIARHFAEKKFKCDQCLMAFVDKRDLANHVNLVHENLRPFVCDTCGSGYKNKQGLNTHLRTGPCQRVSPEEDARLFHCEHCDKRFARQSQLEWHVRVHLDRNPFSCSVNGCHQSFSGEPSLKDHLRKAHHHLDIKELKRVGPAANSHEDPQGTANPDVVPVSGPERIQCANLESASPPIGPYPTLSSYLPALNPHSLGPSLPNLDMELRNLTHRHPHPPLPPPVELFHYAANLAHLRQN